MPYLIQQDFLKQIQLANLSAVIGSNYAIITGWLLAAQEKVASYLKQKFLIELEFTNTVVWSGTNVYYAANRVYLDAAIYDATKTYAIGNYTVYQYNFYIATAISTAITFNASHWTPIAPQYTLYYALYPYPPFDVYANYNVGDRVIWGNNIYTCNQATQIPNADYVLQYGNVNNIPLKNYFPDAPNQNQWIAPTPYSVPANTPITNTTFWTQGDNRSQEMLMIVINIVLYYAHARISPMNIPDHIKINYKDAIQWLKDAAGVGNSTVTPNLIKKQPRQGARIRYGGSIRQNNGY